MVHSRIIRIIIKKTNIWRSGRVITMAALNRDHQLTKSQSIIMFPFVWFHYLKCVTQEPQYLSFAIFIVCPVVLPLILYIPEAGAPPSTRPHLWPCSAVPPALRQVKRDYVGSRVCLLENEFKFCFGKVHYIYWHWNLPFYWQCAKRPGPWSLSLTSI